MSDLYSVTLERVTLVTTYDPATGAVIAQTTERTKVTFHDLPAQTAEMYRRQFPDANVMLVKQIVEPDRRQRSPEPSTAHLGLQRLAAAKRRAIAAAAGERAEALDAGELEGADDITTAATTGDLAAALKDY